MVTRVWEMLDRSRRSLRDGAARQRLEDSTKHLLQRSRETVAQLVGPPSGQEAGSQDVLAGVCSSIALRDLNLVDSLLEQLERMEADEDDPDALDRLYRLDHLATRLRRNGENLRVLAGRDAGGGHDETAGLVDVVRAGMSSIEHYNRVELGRIASLGVVGFAADDVSRLLAELLDNATVHSPPSSSVTVSAHLTEQGSMMIRIEDSGIGLPAARLSALNERLTSAPTLDRNAVRHMGLAVVRRLSGRHGIRVWLARRAPHGTTASVLLPPALVHETPVPAARKTRRPEASSEQVSSDQAAIPASSPGSGVGSGVRGVSNTAATAEDTTGVPAWPAEDQAVQLVPSSAGQQSEGHQEDQAQPATTANGLPRRVSRSLKESSVTRPPPNREHRRESEQDMQQGHEKLLADLGAFTEGEQAAREAKQENIDTAEGSEQ